MDKIKRILALVGVILILGMYAGTLYCALFVKDRTGTFFLGSVVVTLAVPLMLYVVQLIYKLFHRDE